MTLPVVRARQLTRRFLSGSGEEIVALQALDLDLPDGCLIVVRGPSGCGKSTLLNLIGALDQPSEGFLTVADMSIETLSPKALATFRRANLGYLFQDAGLIEPMTVADNVSLPLVYRQLPVALRREKIEIALQHVGLQSRAQSNVSELSGGERQRVGLARALVADPRLLICDEPTAALDEKNSLAITSLLNARASAGRAVLCSTHDPILIAKADVVVSLSHGRLDPEQ